MQAFPQGQITVATPGTPVPLAAGPTSGGVSRIFAENIIGGTGKVYFGLVGMNKTTGAGVIHVFWPTGAGGAVANTFQIDDDKSANTLRPEQYAIDADNAGEGARVTYWQR